MFPLNYLTEIVERHTSASNLDEGTNDGTHHVTQEAVGRNLEIPRRRRRLVPLGMSHVTERRLDVAARLAESTEIVVLHQDASCFVHQRIVELVVQFKGIRTKKRVLACMHIIAIGTGNGRKTGVKVGGNRFDAVNGNIVM